MTRLHSEERHNSSAEAKPSLKGYCLCGKHGSPSKYYNFRILFSWLFVLSAPRSIARKKCFDAKQTGKSYMTYSIDIDWLSTTHLTTRFPTTCTSKNTGMQRKDISSPHLKQSHIVSIHSPQRIRKTIKKEWRKSCICHRGLSASYIKQEDRISWQASHGSSPKLVFDVWISLPALQAQQRPLFRYRFNIIDP